MQDRLRVDSEISRNRDPTHRLTDHIRNKELDDGQRR
jgi:hypothetical protein